MGLVMVGIELKETWPLPCRSSLVPSKYSTRQKVVKVQKRSARVWGTLER